MTDFVLHLRSTAFGWICWNKGLGIRVQAGTSRQALVAFGNALKRVKKEKVEAML